MAIEMSKVAGSSSSSGGDARGDAAEESSLPFQQLSMTFSHMWYRCACISCMPHEMRNWVVSFMRFVGVRENRCGLAVE